ncbi:MAG: AarF/UbiB family protein [Polyangiales bacterium]
MSLFIRLVRALFVFGLIFSSYVLHLGLLKIFRRIETDPASGRETERIPPWLVRRRDRIDLRNARRLLRGMLRLRGVYIKLGQVLSVMGGFLPAVYAKELEQLQDAVPPHPFDEVEEVFIESLRKKPEDVFRSIETTPIAAASLGQVHVAYLPDGTKCAVKVLYPGIRDVIRVDMRVIRLAIRAYRLFVPVQNIETVHAALVDLLRRETDYVHEANCMERMEANFAGEDDILFPKVFREISTADVLTMSFMEGFKITNLAEIDARGIDRRALATRLTECFYKQMFLHRFFHADPHPGNFLVQAGEAPDKPRIVILDFGAISEVEDRFVDGMIDVLRGFFEQNDALVLAGISDMGFVAPDGDRALVEKTVKTYFEKLLRIQEKTAGQLMRANVNELQKLADPEVARQELRALMKSIHYPDGWFYVERAAVMSFWLIGQIDPDLDTFQIGFPYVMPLLAQRIQEAAAAAASA